jgi:hypothetical protein
MKVVEMATRNKILTFGTEFADETKIQELILEGVKNGQELIIEDNIWRVYEVPNTGGKQLKTLIGNNGYIVTAFPVAP